MGQSSEENAGVRTPAEIGAGIKAAQEALRSGREATLAYLLGEDESPASDLAGDKSERELL